MSHSVLGKGLGSLIPRKHSFTEEVIPAARKEVLEISPLEMKENPHQPRRHFSPSELKDLMSSIKEHGILQPLIVTRVRDGYELIAGERRLRAARALGLKTVPVILREANEQQKLELALIENIQREDLNPLEEAAAYRALVDEFNLRQEDIAARVGKNRSTIANIMRLLELPENIRQALLEGRIMKSHARALLAETDPQKQQAMFQVMLKGGITARAAEAKVTGKYHRTSTIAKDANLLAQEKRLREALGTKVEVSEKEGRVTVVIIFYSRVELLDLADRLES